MKKIIKYYRRISLFLLYRFSRFLPDKLYLSCRYYLIFSRKLNWQTPKTFNEKLNWLKLNDRNPLYTKLADKYKVKKYVEEKIGKEYVVPCYGAWDSYDQIDFTSLPNSFVLKANHDSSGAVIILDKKQIDHKNLKKRFDKLLKRNYYYSGREWPYKNIKPLILAEMYLDDNSGRELQDYKFCCFNGVPQYMYCTNKGKIIKENFYNMDFKPIMINHGFERRTPEFIKPIGFEEMKRCASILSKGIPFVRIDFFEVNNKVYFSEFTFYDWGGMKPFLDNSDEIIGDKISLPY